MEFPANACAAVVRVRLFLCVTLATLGPNKQKDRQKQSFEKNNFELLLSEALVTMSEPELDAAVIKATQQSLGKWIKKPPLTEKLLRKPPFRYLMDIFTAVRL